MQNSGTAENKKLAGKVSKVGENHEEDWREKYPYRRQRILNICLVFPKKENE